MTASAPRTRTSDTATEAGVIDDADQVQDGLELLAAGIPLSLLLDLATAVDSREVYAREGGTAAWLRRVA